MDSRITATAVLVAIVSGQVVGVAQAQTFPVRPVTIVVPFPAGGSTDITLRTLATATEKYLGQPIIIENRPGASGTLGPAQVASARADGYTVAQILDTVWRAPFVGKVTFDPARDFTYVIGVTGYTMGVVVRRDAPWRTFGDILSDAKAKPGAINYATSGGISTPEITMERIARLKGVKLTPVPFKGNAEQINALLGGHIHAIASSTAWAPQVEAGQFRLLVTFAANRTKSWPKVPTLREIGINMVVDSPYGLAGPKDMDPKLVKTLHDAFKRGMDEPSFMTAIAKLNQEFLYMNSEEFRVYALNQIDEERRIAQELGLKSE